MPSEVATAICAAKKLRPCRRRWLACGEKPGQEEAYWAAEGAGEKGRSWLEGVVEWEDWLVGEECVRGTAGAGQAMGKSGSAAKGNRSMSWTVGRGGVADVVVAGAGLKS